MIGPPGKVPLRENIAQILFASQPFCHLAHTSCVQSSLAAPAVWSFQPFPLLDPFRRFRRVTLPYPTGRWATDKIAGTVRYNTTQTSGGDGTHIVSSRHRIFTQGETPEDKTCKRPFADSGCRVIQTVLPSLSTGLFHGLSAGGGSRRPPWRSGGPAECHLDIDN